MQSYIVILGGNILTALVVLSQILIILFAFVYFKDRKNPMSKEFEFIKKYSLFIAFVVSLTATLGSLFYSEIAHFTPCKFCWFERIFMYPQVVILGIALWKKDLNVWLYSIVLSIIGAILSLNHYILQMTGASIFPCSAIGQSVSCSKVFVTHLGFITIPLMCFSAFLLMIICMMFVRTKAFNKDDNSQ